MPGFGFGRGFRRRSKFASGSGGGGGGPASQVQYGPKIGPKGPKQVLFGIWNQAPIGYCYETNNTAENLYAKWASRGINVVKAGHPDFVVGDQNGLLNATKNNNLMLVASPRWDTTMFGSRPNPAALDLRSLAINDPYWRDNWISYSVQDEADLFILPLQTHVDFLNGHALDGVTKPGSANFTRRLAVPAGSDASPPVNFHAAFNVPSIHGLSIDSYEWHLSASDLNSATVTKTSPDMFTSTWHGEGIYNSALSAPLNFATRTMYGRRFTASVTGMAVHLQRNGLLSPGRSDNGELPVQYQPVMFNTPPFTVYGQVILPQPNTYAPGDKWTGHYVTTSRVELVPNVYPRAGRWQPGRFLRNEAWSGFVHGSSSMYLFPQTVGSINVTGYINTANNTLVITSEPARAFIFGGALRIQVEGDFTLRGWVRRDNPQLSGTPGGAGVYALDVAKATPLATGTAGAPVTLQISTEARPWGDDSNPENLAELATIIANINRMQAHPTGGNLMIDPVNGGRRAFNVMRCPDIAGDTSLYREDLTLAPIQQGYTPEGVPIPDSAGGLPLWDFGWPMGFEGFRVVGDDGATYLYVRSMSNSNRPTWFPGYAPLGLPQRFFRPFELVGFRRVGTGTAVEMTGSSAFLKAGVDDGPATWFWIESSNIALPEGNSGTTAFNIVVRRGGNLSGTNTVTASAAGTGIAQANGTDFQGGLLPSQVLSFAPNETSKTFTVNVAGDTTAEQDETFKVSLSAPSAGTAVVGSRKDEITCTITNDDAAVVGALVWLVSDLNAAPALTGSPASATYLRPADTAWVTRGGVKMRSVGGGTTATNNGGFAGVPWWLHTSVFNAAEFELPVGNWEVGIVLSGANSGGQVLMIDNPTGAANVRQTLSAAGQASSLSDTDGTIYTNAATAVGDVINNMTYVPVTITNAGTGVGVLRVYGTAGSVGTLLSAISIRQV